MMETIPGYIRKFLDTHNTLSLATADGNRPWATSLFYATDAELNFYFVSDAMTRHCLDIVANMSVAATVNEDFCDWNEIIGVQVAGNANAVPANNRERVERLFLAKFPAIGTLIERPRTDQERIISARLTDAQFYKITTQWLRYIDNSRAFGHKEEFVLSSRDGLVQ